MYSPVCVCVCVCVCVSQQAQLGEGQWLTWHVAKFRAECPNELSLGVDLLAKGDGTVVGYGAMQECGTTALHPQPTGHCWLIVQQQLLKCLFARDPRYPEISTG